MALMRNGRTIEDGSISASSSLIGGLLHWGSDTIPDGDFAKGLDDLGAAICICDPADTVIYANTMYRRAFMAAFDPESMNFTDAMMAGILSGQGIKLETAQPEDFARRIRVRRQEQRGAISFTTDTTDGRWWWVTDTKLPNGVMIAVAQDITSLKLEELTLRDAHACAMQEASTDFLTGIPNRRHGFQYAERLFADCGAAGERFALAVLDIDHFKRINDTYGHETGDRVLVHFAHVLNDGKSARVAVSRIGGEEFLLVSSDPTGLENFVQQVLRSIPPLEIEPNNHKLSFTVSGGFAVSSPGEPFVSLFHRADRALYEAKARGRDRVEQAAELS